MIRKNGDKVEEVLEHVERDWTLREAQEELVEIEQMILDIENMKQRRLEYLNSLKTKIQNIISLFP